VWKTGDFALPRQLKNGQSADFNMEMVPPAGGWHQPALLRIQLSRQHDSVKIEARVNGNQVTAAAQTGEPFANPWEPPAGDECRGGLGFGRELYAWIVPADLLKQGVNTIECSHTQGEPVLINFIDLAVAGKKG
jgi:hypothetical protein